MISDIISVVQRIAFDGPSKAEYFQNKTFFRFQKALLFFNYKYVCYFRGALGKAEFGLIVNDVIVNDGIAGNLNEYDVPYLVLTETFFALSFIISAGHYFTFKNHHHLCLPGC